MGRNISIWNFSRKNNEIRQYPQVEIQNAFPDERMTTPIKYHLEYCSETINDSNDDDNDADFNRFFPLEVSSNLRLTREVGANLYSLINQHFQEHFQDTRLITFDLNSAANHKKANPFMYGNSLYFV